jgi:hypothetical protein
LLAVELLLQARLRAEDFGKVQIQLRHGPHDLFQTLLTWAPSPAGSLPSCQKNSHWYSLPDLCDITDTLIGDNDGVYHLALFNDRPKPGLKGTLSQAELHIIGARFNGDIRNKATRGELGCGSVAGFVWGEENGEEVLFHPDEAVTML